MVDKTSKIGIEEIIDRAMEPPSPRIKQLGQTVIANMMSATHNAKHPPLLPEDGAEFHASIRHVEDGQFQASCHAVLDLKDRHLSESPQYGLYDDLEHAKMWVHAVATHRGFKEIVWVELPVTSYET